MDALAAISPIDGRYHQQTRALEKYFSEHALLKHRAHVEVRYLMALAHAGVVRKLTEDEERQLHTIAAISLKDAEEIKRIEAETSHDVKALEYFLRQKLAQTSMKDVVEFVHFCLTSEDVNNLAYGVALSAFLQEQYLPAVRSLQAQLRKQALANAATPFLGRTHGQPAVPTTMGKEFAVYVSRLHGQFPLPTLQGKLNGAVGNFNAHTFAAPHVNWLQFSERFVEALGLKPTLISTQVLPMDSVAAVLHTIACVNTILTDLCRDVWQYCAMGVLTIDPVGKEVGSSTMPQKVNPILFENAEGNLLLSTNLCNFLASQLPLSRLQRDLVGSTLQRNIGVALAHTMIGLQNLQKGIERLRVDAAACRKALDEHPEVLAEVVQVALRTHGQDGYEQMKALTRGKTLSLEELRAFVEKTTLPAEIKERLRKLTPAEYVGVAEQLTRYAAEHAEIR